MIIWGDEKNYYFLIKYMYLRLNVKFVEMHRIIRSCPLHHKRLTPKCSKVLFKVILMNIVLYGPLYVSNMHSLDIVGSPLVLMTLKYSTNYTKFF